MAQIEDVAGALDLLAAQIRKSWRYTAVSLNKKGGFKADLVEAVINAGTTMQSELQHVNANQAVLDLLDQTAKKMDKAANSNGWVNLAAPPASMTAAGSIASLVFAEVKAWNSDSFEGRLLRVFNYLKSVDRPDYVDWCAAFTSWAVENSPFQPWNPSVRPSSAGARILKLEFEAAGECRSLPKASEPTPEVGDIVFWKRRKKVTANFDDNYYGHVGVVVAVDSSSVVTAEGNSGKTLGFHLYDKSFDKGDYHEFFGIIRLD